MALPPVTDYKDLEAWKVGRRLVREVYLATRALPQDERFGLIAQMRAAAVSIPSNIAEGYGRGTRQEYIRFLRIARGSAAELETQVILCQDLGHLPPDLPMTRTVTMCRQLLNALLRSLHPPKQ